MGVHSILPYAQDRDTAGFFEAAAEGRLVYRACNDCDHALHPPQAIGDRGSFSSRAASVTQPLANS